VPARLVSVPTLVLSSGNRVLPNLQAADFRLFDNERARPFALDTSVAPLSVVIGVQANRDIREYLPFIARTGSVLEALLAGASGESAVIEYGNDVAVTKPFESGDLSEAFRHLAADGFRARSIDAAVRGLAMLRLRPPSRTRVLLLIGQASDHGSEYSLSDLRRDAERDNVIVHALALPEIGKAFVSDTFALRGLSSATERGGFKASADLTRLVPVLSRMAATAGSGDPFSVLTALTGGTELHFRKQNQLEEAIALVGLQLRSAYTLSFTPPADEPGYHALRVECSTPGAKTHARSGYWLMPE
jgi:VWFA-related protein